MSLAPSQRVNPLLETLQCSREGHLYRIKFLHGEEPEVLDQILTMLNDSTINFDSASAEELAIQLGKTIAKQLKTSMQNPAAKRGP